MSKTDVVILGGGISGLSTLHFLHRLKPHLTIKLFEAKAQLGGIIGTEFSGGYRFERGPNGFLDKEPLTIQLCEELGLNDKLRRVNENAGNRYILRKGRLRKVPMSPLKFLTSDVLSIKGRMRVLFEPFVSCPKNSVDESVHCFAMRRIGQEAADYLVQPIVSGIYGSSADCLSMQSSFPAMKQMESEYGSLIKAAIAKLRKARAKGKNKQSSDRPGGKLTSFEGGLSTLISKFNDIYGQQIETGMAARSITKIDQDFQIAFNNGHTERAHSVVLAMPAYEAAKIVSGLSCSLSTALSSISYVPLAVVCFGYPAQAVERRLDGFGFLVPLKENRQILGSIWTSSIFSGTAPKGRVLFRTMVGDDGNSPLINLTDAELIDLVKIDLGEILGITGNPEMERVFRWVHGIPLYRTGHDAILTSIEGELESLGNIYITGNAYRGVGINDCVKMSHRVACSV